MKLSIVSTMALLLATSASAGNLVDCRFPDPHHEGGFVPYQWYQVGDILYQGTSKPKPDDIDPRLHMRIMNRTKMDGVNEIHADWDQPGITTYSNNFSLDLDTGVARESFMSGHPGRWRWGICSIIDKGDDD